MRDSARAVCECGATLLVRYEGNLSEVVYWNILKNDRRQFVQMRVKNLATGRIAELKEHGDTKFDVLDNEIVELSHSYRDGADDVFYSPEGERGSQQCEAKGPHDSGSIWQAKEITAARSCGSSRSR